MGAQKAVVCVADPHFGEGGLENCRLSELCIKYGVVVAVEFDMIVVWYALYSFVFAHGVFSVWQRFHVRLVIFLKSLIARKR